MDVDLDINNYDLEDILNLFKLNYNFNSNDLKKAKIMALKTHPDKSNLDKKYFLFFSEAYNIVLKIYKFRHKRQQKVKNIDYVKEDMEERDKNELVKKLKNFKTVNDFNNWFNDVFDKVKLSNDDRDGGYGDWLNSEEDLDKDVAKNVSEFGEIFKRKKETSKTLVKYNGIRDMYVNSGSNLTNDRPDLYQSDVFSKLKYEDVKQAHTVTVVPVTEDDIDWSKKNESLESYKRSRKELDGPSSLEQSKKYLNEKKIREERVNTSRAYNLYKQDEEIEKSNNKFWSYLKQLGN